MATVAGVISLEAQFMVLSQLEWPQLVLSSVIRRAIPTAEIPNIGACFVRYSKKQAV
jgi:hypothetical protein